MRSRHPRVPWLREVYHARFDHAYPMHTHDAWAVMLVIDGAVTYSLDRAEHQTTPAALTLLPPDVPHDGRSTAEGTEYRKRVLYLEPGWLPATAQDRPASHPTLADPGILASARNTHAALQHPGDLLAAEHWLLEVRRLVLDGLGSPERGSRDAPLARRLRSVLDGRLTESFTIAEVAAQLQTHPSHVTRAFSQAYGIAPHQYVVGRRVDLARRLLSRGFPPADVAARTGFHDQPHMTRHFRRVLGITPRAFIRTGTDADI